MAVTRTGIVAALSTVDGVRPTEYRPTAPVAGMAWPTTTGWGRVQGRIFEHRWGVYVALGIDDRAAAMFEAAKMFTVLHALENIMTVDEVQYVNLDNQPAALLCAVFACRSE